MQLSTKCLLACLVALVVLFRTSTAAPGCAGIFGVARKDCRFGVIKYCGKLICARGYGRRCSQDSSSPFQCGEGYYCLCGRCQGCSLFTLSDCFPDTTNCVYK
uniref:Neuroparsin type 2 n=1 Tax=Tetraclita japonica formosana TaxID=1562191 RepID=A0A482KI12_TETJF|nr:neuroparsin type 2 [Tetraclita japonica formosana]